MELNEQLLSYAKAQSDEERAQIEQALWDEFGETGAVAIFDMSGFTRVTEQYGIIHFLSMVRLMQVTTVPIIEEYRGQLVKFEADNTFAWFPQTDDALRAALAIQQAMDRLNEETPESFDFRLSCGIDYGPFLNLDGKDYFGNAVNKACKLGEDLADAGELLITQHAAAQLPSLDAYDVKEKHYQISGVTIPAYRIIGLKTT